MSRRSLENPDTLEGRLYLPGGNVQSFPYEPSIEDYRYMDMALAEARLALEEGNVAIGAVFAVAAGSDTRVFTGHSTEITDDDLDAHAESNAYQLAKPVVGRHMGNVSAYVTSEPCDACAHRFVQGHVGKLIYAADYNDAPEFFRSRPYGLDHKLRHSGRTILVVSGLRKAESLALLTRENKVH